MPIADEASLCNMALGYAGVRTRLNSLAESNVAAQQASLFYAQYRDDLLSEFNWPFAIRRAVLATFTGAAWSAATAYAIGNLVKYGQNVYKALAASTNLQPDLNLGSVDPATGVSSGTWLQLTRDDFGYAAPVPADMLRVISAYAQPTGGSTTVQPVMTPSPLRAPRNDQRVPFRIEDANDGSGNQIFLTDVQTPVIKYVARIVNTLSFSTEFIAALAWKLAVSFSLALRADVGFSKELEKKAEMSIREAVSKALRSERGDPEPISDVEAARESGGWSGYTPH